MVHSSFSIRFLFYKNTYIILYTNSIYSIQARRDSDSLDHHSIVSFLDLCAKVVTSPTTTVSFVCFLCLFISCVCLWFSSVESHISCNNVYNNVLFRYRRKVNLRKQVCRWELYFEAYWPRNLEVRTFKKWIGILYWYELHYHILIQNSLFILIK